MKKLLLSVSLAVATAVFCQAETLSYGICSDEIFQVGTGSAGSNYIAAIEVPEAVAQAMAGNKVTSVKLGFGSGMNKNVEVFLTYDLSETPFLTAAGKVSVNKFSEVPFEEPYVIEGKKFFIGYKYRQSSSTGKPVAFDGVDHNGMSYFSNLAVYPDGGSPVWDCYPHFGSLSIRATIEGDHFPEASVVPLELNFPVSTPLNKEFEYKIGVYNLSTTPVNSLTVESSFGSLNRQSSVTLDTPVAPGTSDVITVSGLSEEENFSLPVKVSLSQVNGATNLWSMAELRSTMVSSDYVFPRVVVIEEGTGLDCGFCPAGYVALEEMRKNHPNDYIGIAVHNYSYPKDPMNCPSYLSWESWLNPSGYPFASINRNTAIGTYGSFSPQPTTCEALYQQEAGVVNMDLRINAAYSDDTHTNLEVTTTVCFGSDLDSHNYAIALVQTEDNVGPYNQTNNYSGGAYGEMGGFENEGKKVSLIYNDVARYIMNWEGAQGSLPTSIKKGDTYTYSETMPIIPEQTTDGKLAQKHADTNVIALLIDRKDGSIVTAAKCKIDGVSGIDKANSAPAATVYASGGAIEVRGNFDVAQIYSVDGVNIATLTSEGRVNVASGMYAVRISTSGMSTVTRKVIVR